jgi:hypothetical protein
MENTMKDDKFDAYIDTPSFASMDEVENLIQPAWDSLREEAKRLLVCRHTPDDKDNEKSSYLQTLRIVRDMIDDAENGLKRARTEKEAKVQYAVLRKLLAWRNEVEEAFYDASIVTAMMYQEEGQPLSWLK